MPHYYIYRRTQGPVAPTDTLLGGTVGDRGSAALWADHHFPIKPGERLVLKVVRSPVKRRWIERAMIAREKENHAFRHFMESLV